jgi:hypothetical protein
MFRYFNIRGTPLLPTPEGGGIRGEEIDELVLGLGNVQGQKRSAVAHQADGAHKALLQQRVHRVAEAYHLAQGLPVLDRHRSSPLENACRPPSSGT